MTLTSWQSDVQIDRNPQAVEEEQDFRNREEKARIRRAELDNDQFERDMKHREAFAGRAYRLAKAWLVFVIVLTLLQYLAKPLRAGLDPTSFAAVIGTTTLNALGFWVLVGRYLFRQP